MLQANYGTVKSMLVCDLYCKEKCIKKFTQVYSLMVGMNPVSLATTFIIILLLLLSSKNLFLPLCSSVIQLCYKISNASGSASRLISIVLQACIDWCERSTSGSLFGDSVEYKNKSMLRCCCCSCQGLKFLIKKFRLRPNFRVRGLRLWYICPCHMYRF